MEKRKLSYTVGRNVNWCSPMENRIEVPELPYDLAIPLLGIYSEKTLIEKDTCTPMYTAALFSQDIETTHERIKETNVYMVPI